MATNFQKQVRQALTETSQVCPDRVVCKKDGSVEVKRYYFYPHGLDADNWAAKVEEALKLAQVQVSQVTGRNDWNNWPKDSYFVAVVKQEDHNV